jgi:2-isopropylmalate synthase
MTCIPNLELKRGVRGLRVGNLSRPPAVPRHVAEIVNLPPHAADPYVGQSAFAHKGGLHTSALGKAGGATYEHIDPGLVGNGTRVLVSDLGGRAGMAMKAKELGVDLDDRAAAQLTEDLKRLEAEGFVFEAADASLELLMRRSGGWDHPYFTVEGYRATTYHRPNGDTGPSIDTEATVKLFVGEERLIAVGEGNGPVNALDQALRNVLRVPYPEIDRIQLTDYRVRILDGVATTGAVVRVLLDSTDGDQAWTTIGVSPNIIEASWQALTDALVWGLLHPAK